MRHLLKPSQWGCGVTAFAMALNTTAERLMREIGHDGSEMLWPELDCPNGRRSYHPQECIQVALKYGFTVTRIEAFPTLQPRDERRTDLRQPVLYRGNDHEYNWQLFTQHVFSSRGVITGLTLKYSHAVAVDQGRVYDPDGGGPFNFSKRACESKGFYPSILYRIDKCPTTSF